MKAVAYARYSSDNQRSESISAQLRAIYEYADKHKITIVKTYTDEAQSATSDEREAFQAMISELPDIKPDLVLVHKLDRFARNKYDSVYYRRKLQKIRTRLVAVEQDFGEGPEAELAEGILEDFNEYFSKNLSREVKKGHTENFHQGLHIGGIPPLGYDLEDVTGLVSTNTQTTGHGKRRKVKYVINEREAEAVRLIFQRKLEGLSYQEIINELNTNGYKTKSGGPFRVNSLHDILRNEKYNGTYVIRKTSDTNSRKAEDPAKTLRRENAIPRIIEADIFNRVQEIMNAVTASRHREYEPVRYWLTGLIRCGACGGAVSGHKVRRWYYYRCSSNKQHKGCDNAKRINKNDLEQSVLDRLDEQIKAIDNVETWADKIMREMQPKMKNQSGSKNDRQELRKIEKELANVTNAIASGADPKYLTGKLNELGARKDSIEAKLGAANPPVTITRDDVIRRLTWMKELTYNRNDEESCMAFIRQTVKEVLVYPDRKPKITLLGP